MHRVKRGILIGFGLFWLIGFILVAPAPLYRWLFTQSNDTELASPVQLFEGMDWSHPYFYQSIGYAYRSLVQQTDHDSILMYFDPESPLNTDAYMRYFSEYQSTWAYPTQVTLIHSLDNLPSNAVIMISTSNSPAFTNCLSGQENLYLCQS